MNKKTLTGLLSVLCVLLCALVLFCACTGEQDPVDTDAPEVTTEAPAAVTDPETNAPETNAPETDTVVDTALSYTIIVVDADGNPIGGVDVQMCAADGTCFLPVKTGADGVATFEKEAGDYYVTIAACPEGYVADNTRKYTFEGTSTEMTVTLEKAGEATEETEEPTEEITEAPTEPETEDPLREEYDIAANEASVEFGAASYTGKVFQLFNYGQTVLLGDFDLSQYASVIVVYGCDGGAMLGDAGSEVVLTANGAVADSSNQPIDSAEVLGSAALTNPTAGWAAGDREAVITLDTDYSGPVYINHKMGRGDGIAISAIIFVKKESPVVYIANDTLAILQPDLSGIQSTAYEAGGYDAWDKVVTIKKGTTGGIWDMGWVALKDDVTYEFGYIISGAGSLTLFHPSYATAATAEQIAAGREMGATTVSGFLGACAEAALGVGENKVQFAVRLNGDDSQIYVVREYTVILET